MKKIIAVLSLFFAYQLSLAQTINITGVIGNNQGQPLHYAFVQDKVSRNVTYSDSTGSFSLLADPSSQLRINCKGYQDDSVTVAGNKNFQIILKIDPAATSAAPSARPGAATSFQEAFKTLSTYDLNSTPGTMTENSNVSREVVGSRFLFNKWVPGYIINPQGEIVQSPALLFNYDKMNGDLYFTKNMDTVTVANKNSIKAFVLVGPNDQFFTFERMLGISDNLFSQVISTGKKYEIYKLITDKYIKANYKSDGIFATGNNYDEYADEASFYLMNLNTHNFQQLALKKKAIIDAFASEGDRINAFIAAHSSEKIDEDYLKKLGDAMNQ